MSLLLALLTLSLPTHGDKPPSAEQYYAQAIRAMRDVPQPNYATYNVHVHTTGVGFFLTRGPNGRATINLPWGGSGDARFSAAYRKSDDVTALKTAQGWGVIRDPLFDPTWNGINDWIRYGITRRPDSATAQPSPTSDANGLPLIAAVRAMGVAFYRVSDAGAATCANGDPAHRVHLIAYSDPLDHPLTDAVIDTRTDRICFLRLEMRQSVIAAGYNSTFELNIADVNGESLVRNGAIVVIARVAGIGVKSVKVRFAYDRFAFPISLDDGMFPKP
ncbi:MAG TPA: hypothetical protein VNF68_04625 [Candidatus Baltobacteraceae bacterium]|nr:hypothetical protein [Candidatus Baltobacteraceae bacterium]